ncbi:MAG: alpha/beta hydrolase [Luteolibacter sp.]
MSQILQKVAPIGEARDREILKDANTYTYLQRPEGDILAHLFFPENASTRPRPVVIFFHGGFWDSPMPTQFVPQCLHFASRGAVAIAAETRTFSKHGTGALEAIQDARDLVRGLRENAEMFNIDPSRITVGGSAGGAYLALMTALAREKDLPDGNDDYTDCSPQALVLFSALVNTSMKGTTVAERFPSLKLAKKLSPLSLVRAKMPPMLIFQGKSDRITPFGDVTTFRRKMAWRRNKVELVDFEKADHSFFNFNVSHQFFELTVEAADRFLVNQGLLDAPVEAPAPVDVA